MHQNAFGGWALPRPTGGADSTPPDPLGGLRGRGGEKGKGRGGREGRGK